MELPQIFRSALEVMHEAVCLCDEAGAVLYINSAAKELTGWREGSACHEGCRQILNNMDAITHKSCLIDFGQSACGNIELNGMILDYSVTLLQNDGQPCGFLISLKKTPDITLKEEKSAPRLLVSEENEKDDMRKRDRILAGAALATNQLLITSDLDPALNQALEILGCSTDVDRVYIHECYDKGAGEHHCKLSYEWFKESFKTERDRSLSHSLSYSAPISWYETLAWGHAAQRIYQGSAFAGKSVFGAAKRSLLFNGPHIYKRPVLGLHRI